MKITLLSDSQSWKNPYLDQFKKELRRQGHRVVYLHDEKKVPPGDILFILGFFKIVPDGVLDRNKTSVVVHESALPKGRGWSPVHWLVIEGKNTIPMTLFEAVRSVDAGMIYLRGKTELDGTELMPEIRAKVAREMLSLCRRFISRYPGILGKGIPQKGKPTFYALRGPADSELDPRQSIAAQFNRLRVVDNDSYPAYFKLRGQTYTVKIEKKKN